VDLVEDDLEVLAQVGAKMHEHDVTGLERSTLGVDASEAVTNWVDPTTGRSRSARPSVGRRNAALVWILRSDASITAARQAGSRLGSCE
jgi:hypothetical protein